MGQFGWGNVLESKLSDASHLRFFFLSDQSESYPDTSINPNVIP